MKSQQMDFFNFQLSHLFPQLGHCLFGWSSARSGISGALPAGDKWLNNRYALGAHGVFSAHGCARAALQAQSASIPVVQPQPSCWAFLPIAAKGAIAARALGFLGLFFSGALGKNGKVCTAKRGQWLRFAHAWGISWGAYRLLRAKARALRFMDWVDLGGSDRSLLRLTVSTSATSAAAVAMLA